MDVRYLNVSELESLALKANFHPASMAALYPVSLRQLERIFDRQFHATPGFWLRNLQCRLAAELLVKGYSNKATATELKFASESQFCRIFKRTLGTSPQTFAREAFRTRAHVVSPQ
jgi:transcriptional regulator GlxA family with amidase domain